MIPVFHFSKLSNLTKVKPGTFFAENLDSVPVLRAVLGIYGKGYVYKAEIDPVGAVDLTHWDFSGALAWGSKKAQDYVVRTINHASELSSSRYYLGAAKQKHAFMDEITVTESFRTVWHRSDADDEVVLSAIWDHLFNDRDTVRDIVRVAEKYNVSSMYYDTEKDRAGRVWIAVDPQVVSNLRLVKQYDEYTADELENLGKRGWYPG